jgi:hypothetical protein
MTTKACFTDQYRSYLAKLALVENSYYIGIAQTDPWPNEVDEISENRDIPEPLLPSIGLQDLIGIVRVKAIQPLVPVDLVKYPKSLEYKGAINLSNSDRFLSLLTFDNLVWLYDRDNNLLTSIVLDQLARQNSRSIVSDFELPTLICNDELGYLFGLVGNQFNESLRLVKYTNLSRSFKSAPFPKLNEIQVISNIGAVSGQFFISFNGSNTIPVSYNVTPSELKPLLEALPDIGVGNIECSSLQGEDQPLNVSPIKVEFVNQLSNLSQPLFDITNLTLTGNTPTIRVTRLQPGLSNRIVDLAADDSYLTCLNDQGVLIPFLTTSLARANVYSELDLRDLLNLQDSNEKLIKHCYFGRSYLIVLSSFNNLYVLDKYTYTLLNRINLDIPADDSSRLLSMCILGEELYTLTENRVYKYKINFELDNFAIFEYGSDKFVGVSKTESNRRAFNISHIGWYAEILPGQLPTTTYRQTVLLNNVVFKENVNTNKSVFLSSEIESYETVFISNHEPQVINENTYKLLKVAKSF